MHQHDATQRKPAHLLALYSPNDVERLSEKGSEQRCECGFGRYVEREKSLRVVCRARLQAAPTLFGQSQKMNSRKFAKIIYLGYVLRPTSAL
jgi:hypothetical protein